MNLAWSGCSNDLRLDLAMATEITVSGAVGAKLRIDYINQIGPTDAWVTLNTVVLTNAGTRAIMRLGGTTCSFR